MQGKIVSEIKARIATNKNSQNHQWCVNAQVEYIIAKRRNLDLLPLKRDKYMKAKGHYHRMKKVKKYL